LISIHPLVKVCAMRKEISNSVFMTSNMCKDIGEILKKSDLVCLMASDFLGFPEVLEVFVISVNFNNVLCT
jgi:hypothetical protein